MRISKRSLLFVFLTLVFVSVVYGIYNVVSFINRAWDDSTTWTTESRIVFPPAADYLKMSVKGSLTNGDFTVDLPYCQLYTVKSTEDSATLYCSLLTSYYKITREDTINGLIEASDVKLKILKSDPLPTEYLGRIDKSFESVTLFGEDPVYVSLHVEGKATMPEKTLTSLITHAQKAYKHEKEAVPVSITKWGATSLSAVTPTQKAAYAKQWKENVTKEIATRISYDQLKNKNNIDYLNALREAFKPYALMCTGLSNCKYTGGINPADPAMYYLYSQRILNKDAFQKGVDYVTTNMYPFVPRAVSNVVARCTGENCVKNWSEMSATFFTVCPVNDVINNTQSDEFKNLFAKYVETRTKSTMLTEHEANDIVMKYLSKSTVLNEANYPELAMDMNEVCYFLVKNGPAKTPLLKSNFLIVYESALAAIIGSPVHLTKDGVIDAIYKNTAYSSYKSDYILDSNIPDNLAKFGVILTDTNVQKHTEVRTFFGTVILLYLYYGIAN